jgi:hypothetical protein
VKSGIKCLTLIFFLLWIGTFFVPVSRPIHAEEDHWKALGVIRSPRTAPPDFTLRTLNGGSKREEKFVDV